jgi:hypothetical protein
LKKYILKGLSFLSCRLRGGLRVRSSINRRVIEGLLDAISFE